jgi:hypothetical protein
MSLAVEQSSRMGREGGSGSKHAMEGRGRAPAPSTGVEQGNWTQRRLRNKQDRGNRDLNNCIKQ